MHFNKYTVLFALVAVSAALPRGAKQGGQPGDPVTSGLPANIQKGVDNGTLSCVLNSNGDAACSDQSGASDVFPINNTGNNAANANAGGNAGGKGAGKKTGGSANNGGKAAGQPGDPVTSGLPANIQKGVDNGTLSCVLNSNGDAACSDQSGASDVFPINNTGNNAANANAGGNAGGKGAGKKTGSANNGGKAAGQPGDPVTSGLPADVQKKVDNGSLTCELNSNRETVCSDQFGGDFIVGE